MNSPESDVDDWNDALSGSGEAFARIFDRHQNRIFRHSIALVPTAHDAQDVVGITFLEAWRRRHHVRLVNGSVLPWLLVTASHSSQNVRRSSRRYRDLLERVPRNDTQSGPDTDTDGDAVAALKGLPQHQQDVMVLCVLEGLSEAEASHALAIPIGTVKSRLHRAKKTLAERIRITTTEMRPAT
jgi:RNA polymerase sigma factor (sigma-70 family)